MISVRSSENYGTKRWNFQYRFAFVGEGGVTREFYSGKTMDGKLCFKCFPLIY